MYECEFWESSTELWGDYFGYKSQTLLGLIALYHYLCMNFWAIMEGRDIRQPHLH